MGVGRRMAAGKFDGVQQPRGLWHGPRVCADRGCWSCGPRRRWCVGHRGITGRRGGLLLDGARHMGIGTSMAVEDVVGRGELQMGVVDRMAPAGLGPLRCFAFGYRGTTDRRGGLLLGDAGGLVTGGRMAAEEVCVVVHSAPPSASSMVASGRSRTVLTPSSSSTSASAS